MSATERNIVSISEGYVELSVLISDGRTTLRIEANTMTGAKFSADFPLEASVVEDIHNAYYEAERIVEDERN